MAKKSRFVTWSGTSWSALAGKISHMTTLMIGKT